MDPLWIAIIGTILGALASGIVALLLNFINKASLTQENNTHSIIEMKVEFKALKESIQPLLRLKPDVDSAHEKIRGLEASLREHHSRAQQ